MLLTCPAAWLLFFSSTFFCSVLVRLGLLPRLCLSYTKRKRQRGRRVFFFGHTAICIVYEEGLETKIHRDIFLFWRLGVTGFGLREGHFTRHFIAEEGQQHAFSFFP